MTLHQVTKKHDDDPWRTRRNYTRDMWDEARCSRSWTCSRPVYAIDVRPDIYPRPEMRLVVYVHGKYSSAPGLYTKAPRLRPVSWMAHLDTPGGPTLWRPNPHTWSGTCTSVVDARRQADRLITASSLRKFLKELYKRDTARRVYRKVVDEETFPPDSECWEPFMSVFRDLDWRNLPTGEYLVIRYDYASNRFIARYHERSRWGHASRGWHGAVRMWWGPIPETLEMK